MSEGYLQRRVAFNLGFEASSRLVFVNEGRDRNRGDLARLYVLAGVIRDQIPRAIRDKLTVELWSDPFHLFSRAVFKDDKGGKWECVLERERVGDREVACKIPEQFLAHLCIVVQ